MGRVRGQASADYVTSAFIFSLIILFTFTEIARTYYSRTWEMTRAEAMMETEKFVLFLTKYEGNWSDNPFNSTSIAFGGQELNSTKLLYFAGMPYQTLQNRTGLYKNFRIEFRILPSIGLTSDISDFYCNNTQVRFQLTATQATNISMVLLGGDYPTRLILEQTESGKFLKFSSQLPNGLFNLKALAYDGAYFGIYETTFRVMPC